VRPIKKQAHGNVRPIKKQAHGKKSHTVRNNIAHNRRFLNNFISIFVFFLNFQKKTSEEIEVMLSV
jgi:hypothetical protein